MQKRGSVLAIAIVLMVVFTGVPLVFSGTMSTAVSISLPFDAVTVQAASTGKTHRVSEREYLIGAIAALCGDEENAREMHTQALCAFAVVLRTNLRRGEYLRASGALHADPEGQQLWLDEEGCALRFGEYCEEFVGRIEYAIDCTEPVILKYNNAPILAAYHRSNGGMTESGTQIWGGDFPCLVPVKSGEEVLTTSLRLDSEQFAQMVTQYLPQTETSLDEDTFAGVTRSESGAIISLEINSTQVSGQLFARIFSLESANVTISAQKGNVTFASRGQGHGIGLSLAGAQKMAQQGSSAREILLHYYPGATLSE